MSGPSGLAAIAGRIQQLSATPAAVTAIEGRFTALVQQATAVAQAAGAATPVTVDAPSATSTTSTIDGSTPTLPVGAGTTTGTTTGTTNGTTASPTINGVWASRVPNARGQALVPAIAATAERYGLDPAFLAAVFWTESSYTPDVVSPTGAIGYGQLMPETAAWLGVDPWDGMQNMDGSARLYRYYLDKYDGDIELAISAYAAGPGAVEKAGGIPDQFTANYIAKLLGRRDYLNGVRDTQP